MTDRSIAELVTIARSWSQAPELLLQSRGFASRGYDRSERAYQINCPDPTAASVLRCRLTASQESPVCNIPMVVANWGNAGATLKINGKAVPQGKDFRVGHRYGLETTDLVVWIGLQSTEPINLELTPAD